MNKTCRKCGATYTGISCDDCGGGRDNSIPAPPKICSVMGCRNDTAINRVQLRAPDGTIFVPPSALKYCHERGGRQYPHAGYDFVANITRCADCYLREMGPDWRETLIAEGMVRHPSIKEANYADEGDRKDLYALIKLVPFRRVPLPEREDRNVEAVLTGRVVTADAAPDLSKYQRGER